MEELKAARTRLGDALAKHRALLTQYYYTHANHPPTFLCDMSASQKIANIVDSMLANPVEYTGVRVWADLTWLTRTDITWYESFQSDTRAAVRTAIAEFTKRSRETAPLPADVTAEVLTPLVNAMYHWCEHVIGRLEWRMTSKAYDADKLKCLCNECDYVTIRMSDIRSATRPEHDNLVVATRKLLDDIRCIANDYAYLLHSDKLYERIKSVADKNLEIRYDMRAPTLRDKVTALSGMVEETVAIGMLHDVVRECMRTLDAYAMT